MHDFQLKEFLEGIEVAVAVEQGVIVLQAERGDEAVDGLSYGLATHPQRLIAQLTPKGWADAFGRQAAA
jgi:hypothetical protein